MNLVIKAIESRRSIRSYLDKTITQQDIERLLSAATYAPSGNNLQPWKFVVISERKLLQQIAKFTIYESWVKTAAAMVVVYYDPQKTDEKIFKIDMKHQQAIGACVQNILLTAESLGIGSCWIGEILNREPEVNSLLKISEPLILSALITLGYTDKIPKAVELPWQDSVLEWYK